MSEQKANSRKNEKVGQVVSTKMTKTIVVQVTRRVPHPLYKRVVTRRKKFFAHDEDGAARLGDTVRIVESRPLSRLKRWRLGEILRRAAQVSVQPESVGALSVVDLGDTGKS
jgi:small subunit ribosomal protein S17